MLRTSLGVAPWCCRLAAELGVGQPLAEAQDNEQHESPQEGKVGLSHYQKVSRRYGRAFGMQVPGTDNRQLALNIMHWLSRLI